MYTDVFMTLSDRPFCLATGAELETQPVKQGCQPERFEARPHDAGVEPGNVQQRIEQLFHRIDRAADIADEMPLVRGDRRFLQGLNEQSQRMQRLAQVVTRNRQEA